MAQYTPGQAWAAVHSAGGSIFGPQGTNWTADADGQPAAAAHFDNLYGKGSPAEQDALKTIMDAAADAARLQKMNAVSTTDPKCFSKPIISIDHHGHVSVVWKGFHPDEIDCGT